jgi:nucleoside phosphorylase
MSEGVLISRILLVTATKTETQAVLDVFSKASGFQWKRFDIKGKIYYDLSIINNANIYMVQSEMGTSSPGAALLTIHNAINAISPDAVIMVGIAFGIDSQRQKLGDILVSRQIQAYEPQKVKNGLMPIPRGDRVTASLSLLDKFRSGDIDWAGAPVHFGLILSGDKLIDDIEFRNKLMELEPEAIGGDMEGAGLYAAASDTKADWILVKSICDWADGNKKGNSQPLAAVNSASFVLHVIQQGIDIKIGNLFLDGNYARRDLLEIIQSVIQKHLPSEDPLPIQLEKLLEEFRILISTLRAWKEVHNSLDEARSRFDQYKESIELAISERNILSAEKVKRHWLPVDGKISTFDSRLTGALSSENMFSSTMTKEEYRDRQDDVAECNKKGLLILELTKSINDHLGLRGRIANNYDELSRYGLLVSKIKYKIGFADPWWKNLIDKTYDFNNVLTESMYLADKILRSSADRLYDLSQNSFGKRKI